MIKDLSTPLGFEDFGVETPEFHFLNILASQHPAYDASLSVRDLARIGLLMARQGLWRGRVIVSSDWINESTAAHSNTDPDLGYGYMWWVGTVDTQAKSPLARFKRYFAKGVNGQFLMVIPALDLVIVHKARHLLWHSRQASLQFFSEFMDAVMAANESLRVTGAEGNREAQYS